MSSLPKALPGVCLLACLLCAGPASATTVIVPSDEELINGARAIVIAEVAAISAALDEPSSTPFTYVEMKVEEVLKGEISSRTLVLKEQGGEAGGRGSFVYGAPQFHTGERVLVYLDAWLDGSPRVYQMFLGKFSFARDATSGATIITRRGAETGVVIAGKPAEATDEMEEGAYLRMLRATLRASRERSAQFAAASDSRPSLLARPPEYQPMREAGKMRPQFATLNPAARWFEADSGQPVVCLINQDGAFYPQIENDIAAALDVWSTVPGAAVRLISGGMTSLCAPPEGRVLITFNNCGGQWSPTPGCVGVLAQTASGYVTVPAKSVNGKMFYRMNRAYVSFNPYASCYYTSRCNVQEVATHEIGHALGLAHSNGDAQAQPTAAQTDATMYQVAHFDRRGAALRSDDVAGIRFIYPATPSTNGVIITTGTPLASLALGSRCGQDVRATGGVGLYTWTLVADGGALPPGITLSADGELDGTPAAPGHYRFTLKVTDAANGTAVKAVSLDVTNGPRIIAVKYKTKKRMLTVKGERLDAAGWLLLDRAPIAPTSGSADSYVIKPLPLSPGQHEIRVINSQGLASDIFVLRIY
jgi:Matrixin/Putative Ig domain